MELSKVSLDNFDENVHHYKMDKTASVFGNLDFFDEFSKTYPSELYLKINAGIDRMDIINKLTNYTKNMDLSNQIEAGIYEFTISYVFKNDMDYAFLVSIYTDKVDEVIQNFDKKSPVRNKYLLSRLKNGKLNAQELAFLRPEEVNPEQWKNEIEKKEMTEYKKTHMAATDMYKCYECGERKCILYQMQTRSADEPATNFANCLVCYNTFRVS